MKAITSKVIGGSYSVWQPDRGEKVDQSGANLDKTGLTDGDVVPAGTVVSKNLETKVSKIIKSARVVENVASNGVTVKIEKGSLLRKGEFYAKTIGSVGSEITDINTTSDDYDVLTLETTLGALTAKDVLFQSAAEGATAAAYIDQPYGMTETDIVVDDFPMITIKIRGTVSEDLIPPVSPGIKTALKGLINFSLSY